MVLADADALQRHLIAGLGVRTYCTAECAANLLSQAVPHMQGGVFVFLAFTCVRCTWCISLTSTYASPAISVLQVGVGVKGDAWKLHSDYGVPVSPVVDLAELADERVPSIAVAGKSLRSLCANLLGMEVRGAWKKAMTRVSLSFCSFVSGGWFGHQTLVLCMMCQFCSTCLQYTLTCQFSHGKCVAKRRRLVVFQ